MLLATHDAYHWLAGAEGFGRAADHPMATTLRAVSGALGVLPANAAFWLPPFMASLAAGMVFLWCALLGSAQAGVACGLAASISPGFLARTLLGCYDTDLVTILFPLVMSIIPAMWMTSWFPARPGPAALFKALKTGALRAFIKKPGAPVEDGRQPPAALLWIIPLALDGLFSWRAQEWHSIFPYLIRYYAALSALMALILAPAGSRLRLLTASLCFSLPALAGPLGLILPAFLLFSSHYPQSPAARMSRSPWLAAALLCLALALMAGGGVADRFMAQIQAYLKPASGADASAASPLLFPSVAQSIIEVQDLSLPALFPYFHPWLEAAALGFAAYAVIIFVRPAALFLLPFAALGLSSSYLGGRMVMFGAPVTALGLALPAYWLCSKLLSRRLGPAACGWLACLVLCSLLVAPFADMIPALSQGPVINRRHAAALSQAGAITPPDATLWVWWDWGYAAHYFAKRNTIADGAEHGGPSLYLPAAVFATDNPRFARQIIKRASEKGAPGDFFKGLDAAEAQELVNRLRSPNEALIPGKGRQFVITSFEMLKLGFWISNYGNWNFVLGQGEGGALSILPQALAYNLSLGEVRLEGRRSVIFPISISVFEETGLSRRNYVLDWFWDNPKASPARQKAFLESRRNINFLFNRVTDEKLAMDESIYRSMMARLLLCDPKDPEISPYFRLVYDNVFARIYEALPAGGQGAAP